MFCYDGDDGINRDGWSAKSKAALRREEDAIKKFDQERVKMEARVLEPGSCNMIQLLNPREHLTGACLKTFRQHVKKYKGWSVKREVVSEEHKIELKITRKSKVYYTNVYYTAPLNLDRLKENLLPPKPLVKSHVPVLCPHDWTWCNPTLPGPSSYQYHQAVSNFPVLAVTSGNQPVLSGYSNYQPVSNFPTGILPNSRSLPKLSGHQYIAGLTYGNGNLAWPPKRLQDNARQNHGCKKTKYSF